MTKVVVSLPDWGVGPIPPSPSVKDNVTDKESSYGVAKYQPTEVWATDIAVRIGYGSYVVCLTHADMVNKTQHTMPDNIFFTMLRN